MNEVRKKEEESSLREVIIDGKEIRITAIETIEAEKTRQERLNNPQINQHMTGKQAVICGGVMIAIPLISLGAGLYCYTRPSSAEPSSHSNTDYESTKINEKTHITDIENSTVNDFPIDWVLNHTTGTLTFDKYTDVINTGRKNSHKAFNQVPKSKNTPVMNHIQNDNDAEQMQADQPQNVLSQSNILHNSDVEILNKIVFSFLKKKYNLSSDFKTITKEELLGLTATLIFNDNSEAKVVAKQLLSSTNLYGSKPNENLSSEQVDLILRSWFFLNVLGMPPIQYIKEKMVNDKYPDYFTIDSVYYLLICNDNKTCFDKISLSNMPLKFRSAFFNVWNHFIYSEMPFLNCIDNDCSIKKLALKSYEFASLFTATQYLRINGFDINEWTKDDLFDLGDNLWAQINEEDIKPNMFAYYYVPVLFSTENLATISTNGEDLSLQLEIVKEYAKRKVIYKYLAEIAIKYEKALKEWKPRKELAIDIINKCIQDPKNKINPLTFPGLIEDYLNGLSAPCTDAPASITDYYDNLTKKVAEEFTDLSEFLLYQAIGEMSLDEKNFITSENAEIKIGLIDFNHSRDIPLERAPDCPNFFDRIDKKNILFVEVNGEKRTYLYENKNNFLGYKLSRVVINFTQQVCKKGILFYKDLKMVKKKEDNPLALIKFLQNKSKDDLYQSLYQAGYTPSVAEKIWSFIKHLIPFYDCIEGIINKDTEQAVTSCITDVLMLAIPLIQAIGLATRFGTSVMRGLFNTNNIAKGTFGLTRGVGNVLLPTTRELSLLGKSTLLALDPGFSLFMASERGITRFISYLQKKNVNNEFNKLINKLSSQSSSTVKTTYKLVKLPDSMETVPMKMIGKIGNHNMFAKINPLTGEVFGLRYIEMNNKFFVLDNLPTSAYLSPELQKCITPGMYAQGVDIKSLAAPNNRGLMADLNKKNVYYLKYDNNFLKVLKLKGSNLYKLSYGDNESIILHFSHNQYVKESMCKVIKNLCNVNSSGSLLNNPLQILTRVDGYEDIAPAVLARYKLPHNNNYNEANFVREIQFDTKHRIPEWSKAYKKDDISFLTDFLDDFSKSDAEFLLLHYDFYDEMALIKLANYMKLNNNRFPDWIHRYYKNSLCIVTDPKNSKLDIMIFFDPTIFNTAKVLSDEHVKVLNNLKPNAMGIIKYNLNNDKNIRFALFKSGKYYEVTPGNIEGHYKLGGKEIVYFNRGYFLKPEPKNEVVKYSRCVIKRSPTDDASVCNHFSEGLQNILMLNMDKGYEIDEIGPLTQHETKPALFFNEQGDTFLIYYNQYFKVLPEGENYILLAKQSLCCLPLPCNKKIAEFRFSTVHGEYYLNTPLENAMEMFDISKSSTEHQRDFLTGYLAENLTNDEYNAISIYSAGDSHKSINAYMRQSGAGKPLSTTKREFIEQTIGHLNTALEKIPPYSGMVYRGSLLNHHVLENINTGSILMNKSFLSCSVNIRTADHFSSSSSKSVMFKIHTKKAGHYIAPYTAIPDEQEVLIQPNTYYRCVAKEDNFIILEEIEDISEIQEDLSSVIDI